MQPSDISALRARAEGGNADARYELAAVISASDPARARALLEQAAAQGHVEAQFTLAAAMLTGVGGGVPDLAGGIAALERAHDSGSPSALRLMAALTALGRGVPQDWRKAVSTLRDGALRGDAAAKREIAVLAMQASHQQRNGFLLLQEAAGRDAFAAFLLDERRRRGAALVSGETTLDANIKIIEQMPPHGVREVISRRPNAFAVRRAFGPDFCTHIAGSAMPRVKREMIVDDAGVAREHPIRTAFGASLGVGLADMPAAYAAIRMSEIAGLSLSQGEPLNVLRYRPGEEYRIHHDFLAKDDPELARRGQRIRTALLYLNDDYEGGETHFVEPDIRFRGRTGDVLVFDNVDERGAPDISARHAGRPVTRGVKWLATIWFRDRDYQF